MMTATTVIPMTGEQWRSANFRYLEAEMERLMLLCLAPELDPTFERIYAYVQDDATRRYATPYMALSLLAEEAAPGAERASLFPEAPLRRWRLLTMETINAGGGSSSCALRID